MEWTTVEGFGLTHLVIPTTYSTVCHYTFNVNSETATTDDLARTVDCVECLHFAQVMQIPTAVMV